MKLLRIIAMIGLGLGVTACGQIDTVSRTAPLEVPGLAGHAMPSFEIVDYNVTVPAELTVSEANSYYPLADIVWRGDDFGNRKQQIAEIFQTALGRASTALTGNVPVIVDVTILRFHSLTEKTRWTVGGTHSLKFAVTVRNAVTGEIYEDRKVIKADLAAFGGAVAQQAERRGQTQKVRVTAHLAEVFRSHLAGPDLGV